MRRPRRMRRQAAAKRRACHRMAAQLKSQDAPRAQTRTKVESKEGPVTVDEQQPATFPSPMSWIQNKAELIEQIKVRIQQIEEEVEAKRMFEEFKKCIMKEMKFAAPGQAGSGETFSGLKEERIALEEALESYMPYARLRIEDVQSLKSNDLATSCDQPPVAPPVDKEKNKVEKIEQKQEKEDTNGKVIGGSPFVTHEPWQEFNLNQKSDLFGQSTRDYQYQPMDPIVAIRSTQADTFKQSQLGTEVLVNVNRIMAEVESGPKEGTQTASNTGSNLDNARQMHGMSPPIYQPSTASTPQSKSSHIPSREQSAQIVNNRGSFERRRELQKLKQSMDVNYQSYSEPLGMDSNAWLQMTSVFKHPVMKEPQMKISVTRETEKPSFIKTVGVGPYMAINVPEGKRNDFLKVVVQNNSIVWARQDIKAQIAYHKQVCDLSESGLVGKGHQKDGLQLITEEKMKCYEEQMATSPSETSSVIQSSTNLCNKLSKPETDLKNQLSSNRSTIKKMGRDYIEPMLEIMHDVNPCMDLKIGTNIFTCSQKAQDNLCYAFASITGLMSIESIRYAASLADGSIADALKKFMQSSNEEDKYQIVQRLTEEMPNWNQTMQQDGQDASVFAEYLLDRLNSEGFLSPDVFSQHIETWSSCLSCGGERKSESHVYLSVKSNPTPLEDGKKCIKKENCRDGECYQADLLNCPDAVIKVVGSRRNLGTYKQSAEIPYSMKGMGGAEYQLKFATVHLGETPNSGHFVTAISNSGNREDCALVDNGKVWRITREHFDKFRKSAFFVGYELLEAKTKPRPSIETIMGVMQQTMRKLDAREKLAALKRVSEVMDRCKKIIDRSYIEKEARKALTEMLKKNSCTDEAGPLLKEEVETNCLAKLLLNEIQNYTRKPLSLLSRVKYQIGLPEDNKEIQRIEKLSQSKVFGTGEGLSHHTDPCKSQNGNEELICGQCGATDIAKLFKCRHCHTTQCEEDMQIHIEKSRCAINRKINIGFKHTPRSHGRGEWKNDSITLSVIRPQASGNRTQYRLEETDGAPLNWVVRTCSPTGFTAGYPNQEGKETVDGTMWLGEGYSEDDKHLVGVKEEVMYKDTDSNQGSKNVPVWSLMSRFYHARNIQEESGGANLNVHGHAAKNPANLEFERELELIQVGSEDSKDLRMVVRRPGKPDEELTLVKNFEGNDEIPAVDENILKGLTNWEVNMKNFVNKYHLKFQQFFKEVSQPHVPYKFRNRSENLCWVNSATQIFLSVTPNIARDLSAVMKQDSTLSGVRSLPALLLEILAKPNAEHSLANLRNLVLPGPDNRIGSALLFFEQLVKMLNKQAPQSVKGLLSEKLVSRSMKSCPTVACNGTFKPEERRMKSEILEFNHDEQKDGRSAQSCIDRKLKEAEGPFSRSCTNGHEHEVWANVAFPKLPELFLMTAYGGTLDQESSMEVKIQGKTFRAIGFIYHQEGGDGHHFCGLFDATKKVWSRVDDFHPTWKEPFHYSESEKAFKVGSDKLFDNLGVVCYKLIEGDTNQEPDINIEAEENMEPEVNVEPKANDIGDRCNFHTATDSGQQLLAAENTGQKCYVIADLAALLGNPHIHQIFRKCGPNPTKIEQYLQKLCHSANGTIVEDIEALKKLVVEECSLNFNLMKEFIHDTQQDAMEFLQGLLQTLCYIEDRKDIWGNIVRRAPLSTQTREALRDILGHTSTMTTTCTELGCKKNFKEYTNEIVLSLDVNDDSKKSVNSCLKARLQMTEPYDAELCETCSKKKGKFQQQQSVSNLKKCAILQLKRFQDHNKKNSRPVIVEEVLKEGPYSKYRLTGAVLHEGKSLKQGHYTHILRDVDSGRWFKTNDNRHDPLSDEVAKDQLKRMGYILFYSSPDQFPPPLKAEYERKAPDATKSTRGSRKEQVQRKNFFTHAKTTGNNMFKTQDGPPNRKVQIPEMPATSNLMQSEVRTPTEQELAKKIKTNSKSTHQRIIDSTNPLAVTLKEKFGHNDFRSQEQMEATKAIIGSKRDVLVVMPTGEIFFFITSRHNILLQEVGNPLPTSWQL